MKEYLSFNFAEDALSPVSLSAAIWRSAWASPASVPVSVGVNANADSVRIWVSRLAPHSIVCPRVHVTVGVRVDGDVPLEVVEVLGGLATCSVLLNLKEFVVYLYSFDKFYQAVWRS